MAIGPDQASCRASRSWWPATKKGPCGPQNSVWGAAHHSWVADLQCDGALTADLPQQPLEPHHLIAVVLTRYCGVHRLAGIGAAVPRGCDALPATRQEQGSGSGPWRDRATTRPTGCTRPSHCSWVWMPGVP